MNAGPKKCTVKTKNLEKWTKQDLFSTIVTVPIIICRLAISKRALTYSAKFASISTKQPNVSKMVS